MAFLCTYWVYFPQAQVTELCTLVQMTPHRPCTMTSTLLQKNRKSLPKHHPHLPFSQLHCNSSSVLWQLNCTMAPPPWLFIDDLLMADLFLLLPSKCVRWHTESLNSSPFPVILSYSFATAPSSPTPMTPDIFVSSVQLNYHAFNSCVTGSNKITTTGPKIGT